MTIIDRLAIWISLNFISILLGFFLSINISTILGQTGDWGFLSSGLLTASLEVCSRWIYQARKRTKKNLKTTLSKRGYRILIFFNNLKIGVLYGLFVEAFKLGS